MDLKNISEGFFNSARELLGVLPKDIKETATNRMAICLTCENLDVEGVKCKIPGATHCCKFCGCKMSVKVLAPAAICADPDNRKW